MEALTPRLAVVTNLFPNAAEPRRGLFNYQQLKELRSEAVFEVVSPVPSPLPLLASRPRRRDSDLIPERAVIGGMVAHYPRWFALPWLGRPFHAAILSKRIRQPIEQVMTSLGATTILATWAYPDVVATVRAVRDRPWSVIAKLHGSDINILANRWWCRPMVSSALRRCRRVVVVSQALFESAEKLGVSRDRIVLIPNGIDAALFYPRDRAAERIRLGLPADRPLIVYVGNLEHVKGVDVLIEAIARIYRESHSPRPALVIIGDGRRHLDLARAVREMGLSADVSLVGARPHAEIPLWLGAANALCLPSRAEGSPNVVREALACGRPIVATKVGGVPELLHHGINGFLAPKEDPDALAAALVAALVQSWDPAELSRTSPPSWSDSARQLAEVIAS